MKKVALALLCLLLVPAVYAGDGIIHKTSGRELVKDSYIVFFHAGEKNPAARAHELAGIHGGQVNHVYRHALLGASFKMTEGQARGLAHNPHVAFVKQEGLAHIVGDQSNPTWGIDRVDQRLLPLDNNYHWEYDGTGVTAFIMDTGIRTTHNDFGGRASWGIDCTGEGQSDGHGHGTHVAGTVGSATYGVAKNVNLVAVKICNSGGSCPDADILCGIDYATQQKQASPSTPMVANMSIGGPYDGPENDAVNNSVATGVYYAVAAGNDNADACSYSPASAADAYTIGSTTSSDVRSSFSNYGTCVDIFAPGSSILSTYNSSDTGTTTMSGTSMASPHACGAGALVFDEHPTWTPYQVMTELDARATLDQISSVGTGSPNALLYTLPVAPDFYVSCSPSDPSIPQGGSGTSTCTVTAFGGYTGTVTLSCSGNPAGIGCAFSPNPVNPTAASTLTLTVDLGQATGTYNFDVVGDDGAVTHTAAMSVLVTPEGQNGPQDAVYDAGLGAPKCVIAGNECDSVALLDGRDGLGPEPNQPNTLDSCTDGTSGSYHSDESNDRIVVKTLDGYDFSVGATVEIEATVWAWSTGSSDTLDLYYAADANSPSWVYITSIVPPGGGAQPLSATYTLPDSPLQAVRANFRYTGTVSPCSGGSYDDADDLVFAVNTGGCECTSDPDCDDGLWCNGAETCDGCYCQAGTPVVCDDGVGCTDDSCNEGTHGCDYVPNDANCDNGLWCDGTETCDAGLDCQAGTAPDCDDGVGCTDDSCNEGTDQCDNAANDSLCDNGLFCDGAETCDVLLDCQTGTDPCFPDPCDEINDICVVSCSLFKEPCTTDADCCEGLTCHHKKFWCK